MAAMFNPPPAPMALGPQPTWMPYEPTRDCSQGLCSMYCPQWCYFIFPPPPPVFDIAGPSGDGDGRGDSRSQEEWEVSPSDGMDETLISKITVCKYKRGDGFVDSTDCSVCLGEFQDGESLRLLPKCSHAFHLPCIDTWLKSHSNCPLCRCNIAFVAVGMVSPEPEGRAAPLEDRRGSHEFALTIDDYSSGQVREEPQTVPSSNGGGNQEAKDRPGRSEVANDAVVEIREDGAVPPVPASAPPPMPDTQREARMSIADVLQASPEDERTVGREGGLLQAGSSRRCHGEHSKDGGGRAPPDAPTKKLPPAGRSCFSGKGGGRGKDSGPPV
ncbi:unnamed protein product [Triticum turgidum subsp. durum]|uniref:RING-type E3 ubiquitin transferase n=1 Tax=Triticum turgidum subsp. durum TaxID=4567 RepID=A0A9R0YSA5_TRITD|nr:unnamed protein product [Triticum turgidum subsp. durum]